MSPKAAGLLQLYDEHVHVRYGGRTAPEYVAHVRFFLAWLAARGVEIAAVTTADLVAYQGELYARRRRDGRPYSTGAHANRIVVLRNFFRFLYRRGYVLHDPAASLEVPRLDRRLPRVILTKDEVRRMLEVPESRTPVGLRDRAIFEVLYGTGIRASELAGLSLEDVNTNDRVLRVVLGKGRKDRVVPLTRKAAEAIDRYLRGGRPKLIGQERTKRLFLGKLGGPMDRHLLSIMVRQRAKEAGLKRPITCHAFRHTVATHLLRGRADIRHIQQLLGHSSLATTERYTRVEIQDLQRVIARAHPRGR